MVVVQEKETCQVLVVWNVPKLWGIDRWDEYSRVVWDVREKVRGGVGGKLLFFVFVT